MKITLAPPPEPPKPDVTITLTHRQAQRLAALLFVAEGYGKDSLYRHLEQAGVYNDLDDLRWIKDQRLDGAAAMSHPIGAV